MTTPTHTIVTDSDGTFLCDEHGELLPLVPNAHEKLTAIYRCAVQCEAAGLRESDLRAILRDVRNMAHEALTAR